ncbi:MAG: hypothetical protein QXU13_05950 [Desulfurococcaceae archaeon]
MAKSIPSVYMVTALTALAVILRFFDFPYPPAPFLKYDVSGVPLAVIAFIDLRAAYSVLPIYYVIPVIMGSDPIGMAMKCLAELSTFTPLALALKRFHGKRGEAVVAAIAVAIAAMARVAVMSLANYLVTPYWLVWAGWARDLQRAYAITISYLPHIALFNLTIALIVTPLAIIVHRVLTRMGLLG